MSIEDINYMKANSIRQAYTFIIDSSDRERGMYPNPNNYVVNFSTPFKNIIGMEIIDASIPRAMYTIDRYNNELYYYVGDDTGDNIIENGVQIQNTANLLLKNWNYTSNLSIGASNISITSNISTTASNIASSFTTATIPSTPSTPAIPGITYNTTSNIFTILKETVTSNITTTSNIINNSNVYDISSIYTSIKLTSTSNILNNSIITATSNIIYGSNIYTSSNIIDINNIHNISRGSNIANLELTRDRYAVINNSVNIYNIYSGTASSTSGTSGASTSSGASAIGGTTTGITFNLCVHPIIAEYNRELSIMDFSYTHTYSLDTNRIFRNISIDVTKSGVANNTHVLTFTIGERIERLFNINIDNYINIFWSILDTTWSIGIFDINNTLIVYEVFSNCPALYNVFFTKKYLGKKQARDASSALSDDWDSNLLLLKDVKIYNVPMTLETMTVTLGASLGATETISPQRSPVWYKMDEVINSEVINEGDRPTIAYEDVFKKVVIAPGDYTFRTFITKYNELIKYEDMEIMFKETTTPPELSNLIDIYSRSPLILDMKRSTLAENLGFDLYPTMNNEDLYVSKPVTNTLSVIAKMFYSRFNKDYASNASNVIADKNEDDIYIITSPGIVYFIGNKYIIMRCPEIEEHLYRSLSYSKNALGLAKFRVDSIGINSEKLTITKIPVREFHPIGKLSRMSLRFETSKGTLYDFKGLNHNIIFAIFYYEPTQKNIPTNSILNPEYKMNYLDYLYKQEEIEGDSDDDNEDSEDFSRDNIDDYKTKENLYSEKGVQLQQYNKYYQNNLQSGIIMETEEDDEDDEDDDEEAEEEDAEAEAEY